MDQGFAEIKDLADTLLRFILGFHFHRQVFLHAKDIPFSLNIIEIHFVHQFVNEVQPQPAHVHRVDISVAAWNLDVIRPKFLARIHQRNNDRLPFFGYAQLNGLVFLVFVTMFDDVRGGFIYRQL